MKRTLNILAGLLIATAIMLLATGQARECPEGGLRGARPQRAVATRTSSAATHPLGTPSSDVGGPSAEPASDWRTTRGSNAAAIPASPEPSAAEVGRPLAAAGLPASDRAAASGGGQRSPPWLRS